MGGLEVEGITRIGQALDGVVVGEVKAVRPHPNADRIVLCDVDCGDGAPVQIACGADNVAEGQKVPVATPGTTLHLPSRDDPDVREPLTIEARELRGEMSNGMICAEDELGLSDDHSGIMVLDTEATVGQPFPDYLAARGVTPTDAVFDIGLTPNRPDAASHYGVARDVAALTDSALTRPEVPLPEPGGPAAEQVTVDLQAPEACPRYVALLVQGVTVQESPLWLKRRLMSIGLRPRNNIVDITNFVLHACGQPLHAFDFDTLADHRIEVRTTDTETTFTTLDDQERTLPAGTLLICDGAGPGGRGRRDGRRQLGGQRRHHQRPHRERLLRPVHHPPHGESPRPADRLLVPLRARRGPRRTGVGRRPRRPAHGRTGRRHGRQRHGGRPSESARAAHRHAPPRAHERAPGHLDCDRRGHPPPRKDWLRGHGEPMAP